VAGPPGLPSDQASYPAPPAAPPAPTTFRPGITAGTPDYGKAIAGIESGGAYDKLGPQTKTGDRAYGKYQVMGNNIPEWTTQVLGKPMTPEQFLSNPDAQEAVFKAKFGDYVQKYGPEGAAKAWFAGEKGMNNPNAKDVLGTTVQGYGQKFTQALGPQVPLEITGGQSAAPQIASALAAPAAATPSAPAAPAGVLSGVPQEAKLQIARLLSSNNPTAKAMGTALLQSQMAPAQHIDLGNKVGIMDRQGNLVRTIDKGEPNKGPEYGVIGKDEFGNEQYGWRDPRTQTVTPFKSQSAATAPPTITGPDGKPVVVQPGQDPKVIREAISKAQASQALPPEFKDTAKLREEVVQIPSYKNLAQAAPIYNSMRDAAGRDTKAADLNMVYGLGKIMDPTSVVREGELQMANAAQGMQERLNGIIAQIQSKGGLTPEGRQALMAEAHGRVTAYKNEFDRDAGRFKGIAERNRMNPADVVPEFGTFEPWTVPKAKGETEKTAPPTGVDSKIWQHMTPEERSLWK
jgi:hypothetical protein